VTVVIRSAASRFVLAPQFQHGKVMPAERIIEP
jgi:hypothetical protein